MFKFTDKDVEDSLIKVFGEFVTEHSNEIDGCSICFTGDSQNTLLKVSFNIGCYCNNKTFSEMDMSEIVDIYGCAGYAFEAMLNEIKEYMK